MSATAESDPRVFFAAERTFLAWSEPFVVRPTWLGVSTAALLLIVGVLLTAYSVTSA